RRNSGPPGRYGPSTRAAGGPMERVGADHPAAARPDPDDVDVRVDRAVRVFRGGALRLGDGLRTGPHPGARAGLGRHGEAVWLSLDRPGLGYRSSRLAG